MGTVPLAFAVFETDFSIIAGPEPFGISGVNLIRTGSKPPGTDPYFA